jgi:hypothetical protein
MFNKPPQPKKKEQPIGKTPKEKVMKFLRKGALIGAISAATLGVVKNKDVIKEKIENSLASEIHKGTISIDKKEYIEGRKSAIGMMAVSSKDEYIIHYTLEGRKLKHDVTKEVFDSFKEGDKVDIVYETGDWVVGDSNGIQIDSMEIAK